MTTARVEQLPVEDRLWATYKVQLADVLDPNKDRHKPGNRDAVFAIGAIHAPDALGNCIECSYHSPVGWPCKTARLLGEWQGLSPPG